MSDQPAAPPQFTTGKPDQPPRRWFKKKRFVIPISLVVLLIAAGAAGGGDKKTGTSKSLGQGVADGFNAATKKETTEATAKTTTTAAAKLYPGRPDSQPKDHEAAIGQAVEFSGYTTSVDKADFQQSVSVIEKDGYIVATVTIKNRDSKAQRYNPFDFKIQTPNGQVLDPGITSAGTFQSGDLVTGGSVTGTVIFTVGGTKGDYYVIYKPDAFDASRGIWKVTI